MVVCHSYLRISSEDDDEKGGRRYKQSLGLATCRDEREADKTIFIPQTLWDKDGTTHAAGSLSVSEESCSDTTEESLIANQDEQSDSSDQVTREHDAFMTPASSGPGPWLPSLDQPVSYFRPMSWDYATGDICDKTVLPGPEPQISGDYISEITANLKEQDVVILSARKDYSFYENLFVDVEALGHILEIYNISPMVRTQDLLDAFAARSVTGLEVHWVDRTHALAVFSCESAARQALSLKHPLIKVRKLSNGMKKSKGKAQRLAELHRPRNEEVQTNPKVPTAPDFTQKHEGQTSHL